MSSELNARRDLLMEMNFLTSIGSKVFLYPFCGKPKFKLLGMYLVSFLMLLTAIQLFYTLCLTRFKDLLEFINIAPNIGICVMTAIRYIKIHSNKEVYDKIYNHFCESIWDLVPDTSTDNKKIVFKYNTIARFINRFLFYYSIPLIIFIDSFPRILMYYQEKVAAKESEYLYPFDGWYPFDKVKWYYAAYAWESFMTAVVICIYAFTDMLHISYIAYICMELKLLSNCLKEVISTDDVNNITSGNNEKETNDTIKKNIRILIIKYSFLVTISSELGKVLGDVMLIIYTFGSIFICLTAFTATVVDDLYKKLRYFFFFVSLIVSVLNQCIMGQVLSDYSVQLAEAIYSSNWLYAELQTKKILLIFLAGTQRPLKLTANGYVTMNLNTFTCICSSSYQLFNLLRTIYHK